MTNATRAGPVSQAPTPPMLPTTYKAAAAGASHASATPASAAPAARAWRNPDTMLTSLLGTSQSTETVPAMYRNAISGAEMRIERGRFRLGFRTSSPRTAHSSRPANAKAMDAHRLSEDQSPRSGSRVAGVIGVAGGRVNTAYRPSATSTNPGT